MSNFVGIDDARALMTGIGNKIKQVPAWVGSRAEHTAAEQAGTLPTNGIIGISDEEGSGGGGGGGDARSKIFKNVTVYKSSDFERISNGTNTYPCVHFQGKSSGKIAMIKLVGETNGGLDIASAFNHMKHYGGNLSDGILYNQSGKICSTFTYGGTTITKLQEGGIRISGTSTNNVVIRIGTLTCSEVYAGTVRCYGITGDYDGLKLGVSSTSYNATYYKNTACPLDEVTEWSTLLGTQTSGATHLTLYIPTGKTFDCEFYPMVCGKWDENDHYERPFSVNNLNFLSRIFSDYVVYLTSGATMAYFPEHLGRAIYRYSVDYPVVHEGENTFAILSDAYRSYDFEVYYTEDNIERAELGGYLTSDFDSEYEYAKDLILQEKHLLPMVGGSITQDTSSSFIYVTSVYFTAQSSVLPSIIYYGIIPSSDAKDCYRLRRRDFNGINSKTVKSEDFVFGNYSYDERLRLQHSSAISKDLTVYYGLACDYTGFDDSTTIT